MNSLKLTAMERANGLAALVRQRLAHFFRGEG